MMQVRYDWSKSLILKRDAFVSLSMVSLFLVWLNWKSNFFYKYTYVHQLWVLSEITIPRRLSVFTLFDYVLLANAILILTPPPREKLYIYAISSSSHDMIYKNIR